MPNQINGPIEAPFLLFLEGVQTLTAERARNLHGPFQQRMGEIINKDPEFNELWGQVLSRSLLDRFCAKYILDFVREAVALPGDLIECGCYRGGLSLMLALYLKKHGIKKKIYICDSFEGLPDPDRKVDAYYQKGQYAADFDELKEVITGMELEEFCVVKKGWFADTLKDFGIDQKFCFVHIDADLGKSTRDCLEVLYPKLVDGGVAVFDDYYDGSRGVMKVVNQWAADNNEVIHVGPPPQVAFKKKQPMNDTFTFKNAGHVFDVSFDYLKRQALFQAFLRTLIQMRDDQTDSLRKLAELIDRRKKPRGEPEQKSKIKF